jgi:hypothetical protein
MISAKKLVLGLLFSGSLVLPATSGRAAGSEHRGGTGNITICHLPPGDPANAQTLAVGSASLPAHAAHGDTLGECPGACGSDGDACGSDDECCGGHCDGGICAPACGTGGDTCETGADCCTGICTDTTKTCADQCTVGPELHGPRCDRDLDCCEGDGVCIIGLCYPENFGCSMPGDACNPDEGVFCCFDDACLDGVCVAQ